jgi:DDE superfamily endonuclease
MADTAGRDVPNTLAAWMQPFRGAFTAPTWRYVLVLVMGAILVPGRRTVASALRVMGLEQVAHFSNYHRVLSRNIWSGRWLSRRLFRLLVDTFVPDDDPVVIGLDDTSSGDGERGSRPVASIEIRSAPRTATSSRRAACAGFHSCCCPRFPGPVGVGHSRS